MNYPTANKVDTAPIPKPPTNFSTPLTTTQENFNGPQTYQQVIDGCLFLPSADPPQCVPMPPNNTTFTNGHYVDMGNQGSAFIPAKGSFINQLLEIHWCPAQNYFLVKFLGHLLPTLKYTPTMFSAVAP
jgi:hypothetical protein